MIVHLLYKKCSAFLTLPVPACPKGKLLYKCAKTTKNIKKLMVKKSNCQFLEPVIFFAIAPECTKGFQFSKMTQSNVHLRKETDCY